MPTLSIAETIQLCRDTGFPEYSIVNAVAIAVCESELNPRNRCLNCFPGILEDSRGLWQINVRAHPQFADVDLFDPRINCRAALEVSSNGSNFRPWSAFTNNCYRQHTHAVLNEMKVPIKVVVRGQLVNDADGFLLDSQSFAWIRPISNRLGAVVTDFTANSVTLALGGVELDIAAHITAGRAFVHLGDLRLLPGIVVTFDGPSKTVTIG